MHEQARMHTHTHSDIHAHPYAYKTQTDAPCNARRQYADIYTHARTPYALTYKHTRGHTHTHMHALMHARTLDVFLKHADKLIVTDCRANLTVCFILILYNH